MSSAALSAGLRARRTLILLAFDGLAILFSYAVFGLLRYWPDVTGMVVRDVAILAVAAVLGQWVVGSLLRVYQGRTVVASLDETLLLGVATAGVGAILSTINAMTHPILVSRILPVAATFMALFGMLLGRALWRSFEPSRRTHDGDDTPTLILGAGSGGRQLLSSMTATSGSGMRPVGLLDDDPWKRRLRLSGVPVLGLSSDLAAVVRKTEAQLLVIAIPSAQPDLIREISAEAKSLGVEVKVLPGVGELFHQHASIRDIRDINVLDLLGRGAIETDVESIAGYLTGKRVLVTGAGGSIGSELCRQIHKFGPSELMMLDRDESALHGVQLSIHGQALLDSDDVVLADIRDVAALHEIFMSRKPEVVFHAAALKHLPMLEQYPTEAMKTNVLGTINVLKASALVGVERFVNISTDKAAEPSSVLGYSKRVAERLTASVASDTSGTYLSVRFGNVLGSRGSVLTAFAAQIAAGGPVTVTHPEVTRYFMTVQEAVQLVIQAAAIGRDGEALILDMGEPVRIQDVAEQLIDQSGRQIEIIYTGLRQGEKMHEILLGEDEVDERPEHAQVSHVIVPELSVGRIASGRLDLSRLEMTTQLRDWCTTESLARQDDLQLGSRDWSSTET